MDLISVPTVRGTVGTITESDKSRTKVFIYLLNWNKLTYCPEMNVYFIYVDIYSASMSTSVIHYTYIIYDDALSPLNPRKYIVLTGNFVFYLHGVDLRVFEERNSGVKREKSVIF